MQQMKIRTQKGFFHIHLSCILLVFALIGGWYVYKSYKENRLKENMQAIVNDYQPIVQKVITFAQGKDKQVAQEALNVANNVANEDGVGEQQVKQFGTAIETIKKLQEKYKSPAEK